jgi:hypothetical protein
LVLHKIIQPRTTTAADQLGGLATPALVGQRAKID